jgi:hypothetical protein
MVCVAIFQRTSFLLAGGGLLGVLLSLSSGCLVGSFFLLGLLLGFQGSFLLFHDLFVLLDGFGVHLDGGVAESAVVSVPVLGHEGAGAARWASLSLLGDVSLAYIRSELPSMP